MKNSAGFTLIELAMVMTIMAILLGFITISLVSSHRKASLTSIEEILLADLKQQQLKSMIGDTQGGTASDSYGVHFDTNRYVLFRGSVYSSSETSNFTIDLNDNMQFNSPLVNIVFSKIGGEIATPTIIELQDNTNNKVKRIHLNTLGTITEVESL